MVPRDIFWSFLQELGWILQCAGIKIPVLETWTSKIHQLSKLQHYEYRNQYRTGTHYDVGGCITKWANKENVFLWSRGSKGRFVSIIPFIKLPSSAFSRQPPPLRVDNKNKAEAVDLRIALLTIRTTGDIKTTRCVTMASLTSEGNITSFQKKGRNRIPYIQGTRQSVQNAQILASSGVPSLDHVLGKVWTSSRHDLNLSLIWLILSGTSIN